MDRLNFALMQRSPRVLLALAACSAMLVTGCANMTATNTLTNPLGSAASITGKVHGGNQPVSGATVNLRFAGVSGLGKPAPGTYNIAASTTSSSDGTGSFSFIKSPTNGQTNGGPGQNTFSCPNGSSYVYLEAIGGNTLNNGTPANNSAAVFVAPLGLCTAISSATFVDMSEATTVAFMAANAQYFDPTTNAIGSDGINLATVAIANSFALAAQLVDLTKGVAQPSFTLTGGGGTSNGVANVTVTGTPEAGKLNEIANIISACVNTASASSTACQTLFANALPPSVAVTARPYGTTFPVATDVRQALYYIFTNPTNGSATNLQNLYNLAPAAGAPYQPALSSPPSDWTLAISYNSTSTCGSTAAPFISSPSDINVDFYGNVWFGNATSGNLSAITNTGTPYTCLYTSAGFAKAGGVISSPAPNTPYIWTGGTPSGLVRYNEAAQTSVSIPTASQVQAIAADNNDNLYFATSSGLYLIAGGSTATSSTVPLQISSVVGSPSRIVVDSSTPTAIWSASGSSFISQTVKAASGSNLMNGYVTNIFTTNSPAYGIAVSAYNSGTTPTNNVFASFGTASNSVTQLSGSGMAYTPVSGWPTSSGYAGLNDPTSIVLDGVQNAWVPNLLPTATTTPSIISEISQGKVALSPNGFQKAATYLGAGRAAMVDQSGNVWVAGDGATSVTEIVGAAVPVCQPASYCLGQSRFQSIP